MSIFEGVDGGFVTVAEATVEQRPLSCDSASPAEAVLL
jgi:hypothetical protein